MISFASGMGGKSVDADIYIIYIYIRVATRTKITLKCAMLAAGTLAKQETEEPLFACLFRLSVASFFRLLVLQSDFYS